MSGSARGHTETLFVGRDESVYSTPPSPTPGMSGERGGTGPVPTGGADRIEIDDDSDVEVIDLDELPDCDYIELKRVKRQVRVGEVFATIRKWYAESAMRLIREAKPQLAHEIELEDIAMIAVAQDLTRAGLRYRHTNVWTKVFDDIEHAAGVEVKKHEQALQKLRRQEERTAFGRDILRPARERKKAANMGRLRVTRLMQDLEEHPGEA